MTNSSTTNSSATGSGTTNRQNAGRAAGRAPGRLTTIALILAALLLLGTAGCSSSTPELKVVPADDEESYDYDYTIPPGTGVALDQGEEVTIVPQVLDVKVGERIRVVNEDVRGAAVGIFWVPAGGTVAMEFTTEGTLTGECDVHPSGEFTINVT